MSAIKNTPAYFQGSEQCNDLRRNHTGFLTTWVDPFTRPTGAMVQEVQYWITSVLLVVGFVLFALAKHVPRRKYKRLEPRGTIFVFVTHLAAFIPLNTGTRVQFSPLDQQPSCWWIIGAGMLAVPGLALPLLIRMLAFYRENTLVRILKTITDGPRSQHTPSRGGGGGSGFSRNGSRASMSELNYYGNEGDKQHTLSRKNVLLLVQAMFAVSTTNARAGEKSSRQTAPGDDSPMTSPSSMKKKPVSSSSPTMATVAVISQQQQPQPDTEIIDDDVADDASSVSTKSSLWRGFLSGTMVTEISIYRFLSSTTGTAFTLTLFFLPYLVTFIAVLSTDYMVANNCSACFSSSLESTLVIVGAAFALAGLVVSAWMNRACPDGFGIVYEVKMASLTGGLMAVVGTVLSSAITLHPGDNFTWQIFTMLGILVFCMWQSIAQVYLAWSLARAEKRIAQATPLSMVLFERVLDPSTHLHRAFDAHLAAEHNAETLLFHDEAMRWKMSFADIAVKVARIRAKKLIAMYVGPSSLFPVNLSGPVVDKILTTMADANTPVPATLFNEAIHEIKDLLWKDSFFRFAKGKAYKRAMEEDDEKGATGNTNNNTVAAGGM